MDVDTSVQTDRQAGRQADRQTDTQTDSQTDRQTDRQTALFPHILSWIPDSRHLQPVPVRKFHLESENSQFYGEDIC